MQALKLIFMTPPSRLLPFRFSPSPRNTLFVLALFAGSVCPLAASAMQTPNARASLKGLTASPQSVELLRERVVQAGLDAIGTPYAWGGKDLKEGVDCSGFVTAVFREVAGMDMPRRSRDQRSAGKKVEKSQIKPGDLVFFNISRRGGVSHVGIYIGEDKFVHAPTSGSSVRVDNMDSAYWTQHFRGARAYLKPESVTTALLAPDTK
jgi:cell wall-associated NlpC family hydrolase